VESEEPVIVESLVDVAVSTAVVDSLADTDIVVDVESSSVVEELDVVLVEPVPPLVSDGCSATQADDIGRGAPEPYRHPDGQSRSGKLQ
jgi:hypothetical protein